MKNLFMGTSQIADQQLYHIVSTMTTNYDCYIGSGGSAIIAAIKACKMGINESKLLLTSLSIMTSGYGWNDTTIKNVLNEGIPSSNISSVQAAFKLAFGDKTLRDVPLGVVVYNMTTRKVELFRNSDISIVDALTIAISMPGFYYPTFFKGNQYIDVTPINRYPIDVIPSDEEVYGIYIRSMSTSFLEEIISASTKPWQDIIPDLVIDINQ